MKHAVTFELLLRASHACRACRQIAVKVRCSCSATDTRYVLMPVQCVFWCGMPDISPPARAVRGLAREQGVPVIALPPLPLCHACVCLLASQRTGTVLRAMDRGISSANTVVDMLFLRLVPTVIELIVLCLLFIAKVPTYCSCAHLLQLLQSCVCVCVCVCVCLRTRMPPFAQFNAYGPALALFIGFVSYFVLTILLTEWRRRFQADSNRKDNDANERAVDSLTNFGPCSRTHSVTVAAPVSCA